MSDQLAETPVLDLLATMTAASVEASSLDPLPFFVARLAALVAVDAPPISYMANLGAAQEVGIDAEQISGVLTAVAPIVGTTRVVAATDNIGTALGIALGVAALEEELAETEAEQDLSAGQTDVG